LEVELNIPFLKDGLRILIPPDMDSDPRSANMQTLKQMHSELYSKRDMIFKGYNPVYMFAMDKIGKNIFSENCVPNSIVNSRSEEDFWSTFSLYHMTRSSCENHTNGSGDKCQMRVEKSWKKKGEPPVFSAEVRPENELVIEESSSSLDC
jgi:hypothetical protein